MGSEDGYAMQFEAEQEMYRLHLVFLEFLRSGHNILLSIEIELNLLQPNIKNLTEYSNLFFRFPHEWQTWSDDIPESQFIISDIETLADIRAKFLLLQTEKNMEKFNLYEVEYTSLYLNFALDMQSFEQSLVSHGLVVESFCPRNLFVRNDEIIDETSTDAEQRSEVMRPFIIELFNGDRYAFSHELPHFSLFRIKFIKKYEAFFQELTENQSLFDRLMGQSTNDLTNDSIGLNDRPPDEEEYNRNMPYYLSHRDNHFPRILKMVSNSIFEAIESTFLISGIPLHKAKEIIFLLIHPDERIFHFESFLESLKEKLPQWKMKGFDDVVIFCWK
jgi:hypothetical protein